MTLCYTKTHEQVFMRMTAGTRKSHASCEVFGFDPKRVKAARRAVPRAETVEAMASIFQAVSDPARLRLLLALAAAELCVCDLSVLSGLSQSAVSHHLRVLRDRKVVKYRKSGKMAYYTLEDAHVKALLRKCLEHVNEE